MIKFEGPVLSCEWCKHHGYARLYAFCLADEDRQCTLGNKTPEWCPLQPRLRDKARLELERDIEIALENQRKLSAEKGKALGELSDAKQRIKELEKLVDELRHNQLHDH